jgi:hemerythrin-like domain-containing protein
MPEHKFISHLKKDHEKQKELGTAMTEAEDPAERDRLRKEFYIALYPHMMGEEAAFFNKMKEDRRQEVRADALEGLEEHHAARVLLRELLEMDPAAENFTAKAKVLDEMNRHHIEEEEGDVFVHMEKIYSRQQLSKLFETYEQREEEAKGDYPEHSPEM